MSQWKDESISKRHPVFIRLTEILLETASHIANLSPSFVSALAANANGVVAKW